MLLLQVLYKVAGTAQEIKFLVKNSSDKFQQFHLFIYLFIYLFIHLFIYLYFFAAWKLPQIHLFFENILFSFLVIYNV